MLLPALGMERVLHVTRVTRGEDALRVIARARPHAALVDVQIAEPPGITVAETAAAHDVPVLMLAPTNAQSARLARAGLPVLMRPLAEETLLRATRELIAQSHRTLDRVKASFERTRELRRELVTAIEHTRIFKSLSEDRIDRLKRSGVPPHIARRPNLLDDWDVVRAAQHMLETHGERAWDTANERAEQTRELAAARRWRAIAAAIRSLEGKR